MPEKELRILIGPIDTASFPSRLGRSLAERGCRCWVLNTSAHRYHASTDRLGAARPVAPASFRLLRWLEDRGPAGIILGAPLKQLLVFAIFLWSLFAVDAVVFVSGRSLFRGYWDLWIYRLLGKRVVRVFLGSDSRPKYLSGPQDAVIDSVTGKQACRKLAASVKRQQKRIARMSAWSDVVVENPLCGHFQTKPFVSWFCVGFPHDPGFFQQQEPAPTDTTPRSDRPRFKVLHCPSNPRIKGTDRVDAVMERLQQDGMELDYVRITGMAHHVVLQHLQTCDFVIDELYSDTPMAGFASEAAAFGRPVLVGGYGWETIQRSVPAEFIPPNLCVSPDDFETVLPDLIRDETRCRQTGQQALEFMNGCWHYSNVADRFLRILAGDIPDEWWVMPRTIDYWQGLGATQSHREQVLKNYLKNEGLEALRVSQSGSFFALMSEWHSSLQDTPTHPAPSRHDSSDLH